MRAFETVDRHWGSPELQVDTYACARSGAPASAPFRPPGLKIALPRTGVCGIAGERGALLSDATRVSFLDPAGTYAIEHLACDCRSPRHGAGGRVRGTVLTFAEGSPLAALFLRELRGQWLGAQRVATAEVIALHCRLLRACATGGDDTIASAARRLCDALLALLASPPAAAASPPSPPSPRAVTAAALAVVGRDLGRRWSLDTLAAAVGCSKFYLCRSFRQTTGTSVERHLMSLRLATAALRLGEGEPDLATLALDLGFASHSHLTACFRARFAAPPSAFRRRLASAG